MERRVQVTPNPGLATVEAIAVFCGCTWRTARDRLRKLRIEPVAQNPGGRGGGWLFPAWARWQVAFADSEKGAAAREGHAVATDFAGALWRSLTSPDSPFLAIVAGGLREECALTEPQAFRALQVVCLALHRGLDHELGADESGIELEMPQHLAAAEPKGANDV